MATKDKEILIRESDVEIIKSVITRLYQATTNEIRKEMARDLETVLSHAVYFEPPLSGTKQ